jgi:hypothetical protein
MEITAVWDITLCNLVGVYRRFRGAYCLHHHPHYGGCTTL